MSGGAEIACSQWHSHASADLESRLRKALKIERLLQLHESMVGVDILEIGTGSGAIAHHLASHPTLATRVTAVDVVDERVLTDGYAFELVTGAELPFETSSFDYVISNHVIEHLRSRRQQVTHIQEITRVTRSGGKGYLATPNRWAVVEPHYRLPLLSWLPESWRSAYVRVTRRGGAYDIRPLSSAGLDALLAEVGAAYEHAESEAVRLVVELEPRSSLTRLVVERLPRRVLSELVPILPTQVRILHV